MNQASGTGATKSPIGGSAALAGDAPVQLARYRVRDFRGVQEATLDLGVTTVVVGENNVGKSALLEALDVALGNRSAFTTDLRIAPSGTVSEFSIDMELRPSAGKAFDQGTVDLLGVTYRPAPQTGVQSYFLRAIGRVDETQRAVRVQRGFVNAWESPRAEAFSEELSAVQRQALWFALLDAQRDLADDLRSRTSPWGKLLRRLQLDANTRADFEHQLAQLSSKVTTALPDSAKLASSIERLESVLAGQVSKARVALLPRTLEDLWRTTDLLVQASGHPELSIGQQGMGARSLSAILAFRAWLEAEIAVAVEPPIMVVTAFEEPEAHLHPQAQRAVFGEIATMYGQKVISTHSPYVASVAALDAFRVVRRSPTVEVRSAFGIEAELQQDPDGLANIRRFCLRRNGDMIFARLVILGEGDTEAGVLPAIARVWWTQAPEVRGVAIVPMDGVNNARTFASFLERLGVPWLALLDGDPGGLDEKARMAKVPALAGLVASRVLTIAHAGRDMDLEELLGATVPDAVKRAIVSVTPSAAFGLQAATAQQVADQLRSKKATLSARVGEELAKAWPTGASFPPVLEKLFKAADALLA